MSKNVQWRDKDGNICCGVKPEAIEPKTKEQPAKKVNKTTKKG